MKNLVLTGGGSAGHAVPNAALIPALRAKYNLFYMGTDGIEKRIIAPYGIPYCAIRCTKLVWGFALSNFAIPFRFLKSVKEAERALAAVRADVVFSKGGYAALPAVVAAARLHIPVLSHESDLSPGLANRIAAKRCLSVLTSFPETAKKFRRGKYTGAPLREELFSADKDAARKKYGFSGKKPVLLALGGGSGSRTVNGALRGALFPLLDTFDILHICGQGNVTESNACGYRQREFEADMASAYAAADCALSRAGAGAAFELIALKIPTLFVPLENRRTRGDQAENAAYFAERGLAAVLRERELTPASLRSALLKLKEDGSIPAALADCTLRPGNEAILAAIDEMMR